MNHEDRRIRKTKKAITDAFWMLAETKDLGAITVKDICDLADINRSSFYYHYEDLPALIDELESAAGQAAYEQFSVMYQESDYARVMIENFLQLIQKDRKTAQLLIYNGWQNRGMQLFRKLLHDKVVPYWMAHSQLSIAEADGIFAYSFGGCGAIVDAWYQGNISMPYDDVVNLLSRVMTKGIDEFVDLQRS